MVVVVRRGGTWGGGEGGDNVSETGVYESREEKWEKKINHIGPPHCPPPIVGLSLEPGEASVFNLVQSFHYYIRLDILISELRLLL